MSRSKEQRTRNSIPLPDDMDALTPPSSSDDEEHVACAPAATAAKCASESRPVAVAEAKPPVKRHVELVEEHQMEDLLVPVVVPSALDLILDTDDDEGDDDDGDEARFFRGASPDSAPRRSAAVSNVLPVQQAIFSSAPNVSTVAAAAAVPRAQPNPLSVREASRLAMVRASWYRKHVDPSVTPGSGSADPQQQQPQTRSDASSSSFASKRAMGAGGTVLWSPPQVAQPLSTEEWCRRGPSEPPPSERPAKSAKPAREDGALVSDDTAEWRDACEKARQALLFAAEAAASSSSRQRRCVGASATRLAPSDDRGGVHPSTTPVQRTMGSSSITKPSSRPTGSATNLERAIISTAARAAPPPTPRSNTAAAAREQTRRSSSHGRDHSTCRSATGRSSTPQSANASPHGIHHEQRSSAMVVREDWTKYSQKIAFHDDEADVKALQKGGSKGIGGSGMQLGMVSSWAPGGVAAGKSRAKAGPKTVREIIGGATRGTGVSSNNRGAYALRSTSQEPRVNQLAAAALESEEMRQDLFRRRSQADQVREKMLYYSDQNRRQAALWQYRQDSAGAEHPPQHYYTRRAETAAAESASATSNDVEARQRNARADGRGVGSLRNAEYVGRTPSPLGAAEHESLARSGGGSATAHHVAHHHHAADRTPPRHRREPSGEPKEEVLHQRADNQPRRHHARQGLQQWQMIRQFAKQLAYQGRQCAAPSLVLPS